MRWLPCPGYAADVVVRGKALVISILQIPIVIIIIIIEGLSLLQSIPPTTADKQTQAQKTNSNCL